MSAFVVDSSALIAILFDEPERRWFQVTIVSAAACAMSTFTYLETLAVFRSRRGDTAIAARVLSELGIEILPFSQEHLSFAVDALSRYGKGRHPARLNLGDCCSYALARALDRPLLCKGDDFPMTDLKLATAPLTPAG